MSKRRRRPTKLAIPSKPEPAPEGPPAPPWWASAGSGMAMKRMSSGRSPVTKMPKSWDPPPPPGWFALIEKLDNRKPSTKRRPRRKHALQARA